ncbi:MAG: LacI family DNA-binding transcriptional regulator [Planctomycetota bacterium]|nr:LacI family DNA-binding transcriptional regulator [Planctomycetota bacterium]
MSKTTIQDIARVAEVSKSTVSRVLNGTAAVNPEKKAAVLKAIDRLGFKPNVIASSLAGGRSMTIGVVTQLIGSPFYDTIAQGVVAELHETDYSPIFADGRWQAAEELEAIQALMGRRVDGLVLIGGSLPGDEISDLCGDLPTVIVARQLSGRGNICISMDNELGSYQLTKHLIDKGHRKIAVVRGLEHHRDATDRFEGYQRALRDNGIELDSRLVYQGDFSAESGMAAVDNLLAEKVDFTAVVAANDLTAFGVRLALHHHKVAVPEQVSIVGFDDQLETSFTIPPLTTLRQPAREMGSQASKALLEMIAGNNFSSKVFQGELVLRESVAEIAR